jgi:hypothetical protein
VTGGKRRGTGTGDRKEYIMGFTPYTGETDYISKLDDLPNDVGGLTASELKAMFDRYGKEFTEWFNTVHLGEVTLPRLGGSNKNLLDNADFRNPVNQRGLTTYSFTNYSYGYSLDRYVIFSGVSGTITLTKNTGYITLAATNTNGGMNQYLETVLRDGNYTFTVKLSNGIYYSKIFSVSGTTVTFVNGSTPTGLNLVLGYDGTQFFVQVYITAGYSFNLAAIKLELGSVSTLANDPPADYGEELRKCQRYYYAPTAGFDLIARTWTSTIALATVQFPSVMRVSPTIIIKTYGSLYDSSGQHSITNISSERFSGNYLRMQIKGTGLVSGQYPAILVDTELAFSADL